MQNDKEVIRPPNNILDNDMAYLSNIGYKENQTVSSEEFEHDKGYLDNGKFYEPRPSDIPSIAFARFDELNKLPSYQKFLSQKSDSRRTDSPKSTVNKNSPGNFLTDIGKELVKKLSNREKSLIVKQANKFFTMNNILYIYYNKYGMYAPLDNMNSDIIFRRQVPEVLLDDLNATKIGEYVKWLKAEIDWPIMDAHEVKRINSRYINFKNITLELPSLTPHQHNPSYYCTNTLNVDYYTHSGNFERSLFAKVINDMFHDDTNRILLLQEIFAVVIANIRLKHFYYFCGLPNTGKSIICDVLQYIIGTDYTTAITLRQAERRFGLGGLAGKKLNVASESSEITINGMETIKRLTGNDLTQAERKNENAFDFLPEATLIFMSNKSLHILDGQADNAFLNRMVVLTFDNEIPFEKQDLELSQKLKQPNEIQSILAWALEGVERLYRNDFKFSYIPNPCDYIKNYAFVGKKNEQEMLAAHFREYLQESFYINPMDRKNYTTIKDMYDGFKEFIETSDDFDEADNKYLQKVLREEYMLKKGRVKSKDLDTQVYAYYGLILKDEWRKNHA